MNDCTETVKDSHVTDRHTERERVKERRREVWCLLHTRSAVGER